MEKLLFPVIGVVILVLSVSQQVKGNADCHKPLGLADGRINDTQITAGSVYQNNNLLYGPSRARLYQSGGYRAKPGSSAGVNNLKVYFQQAVIITGIATQGYLGGNIQEWTKKYLLRYTNGSGKVYFFKERYQSELPTKIFQGNFDSNTVVHHYVPVPTIVDSVRLIPTDWNNNFAIRLELYGCIAATGISPSVEQTTTAKDGVGCPKERLQGVTWSETSRGKTNLMPCPDGSRGKATRKCSKEGQWNKANYSDCISVEFEKLHDEMEAIMEDRQSRLNAQEVLSQLANVSQPVKNDSLRPLQIYTRDLTTAVDILVKLAEYNNNTGNVSSKEDFENFAIVASNLLDSTNKRTWKELDKAGQGTIQILVKAVDDYGLGVAVTLNGSSKPRTAETRNLAMRIDRVGQNSPVRVEGLKAAYKKSSIILPPQAFSSSQDFSVVTLVYLTLNAVLSLAKDTGDKDDPAVSVNTTIVSSTVSPKPPDVFNRPVEIVLQNKKMSIQSVANQQAKCVFWRPGESAMWNSSGCKFVPGKSNVTMTSTCECDHLTVFGALIDPYNSPVSKGLEIISIIGCSVSLISVVITMAVTLFFWRILKTPRTKVLLNLCAAIAITCALVIVEGLARKKAGCPVVAALLHYFLMALFSWMLCEGLLLFINVVKPHQAKSILRSKIQYFYIFGWGFPAIVVAISLAATQTNGYGSEDFCWFDAKSGLIWAFIVPALLVILINIVVFILMICATVRVKGAGTDEKERLVKLRAGIRASVVVLPLLGVIWLFGLLSFNSDTIAFKYIFTIFNSLQGLMIFIFHCLKDREVKNAVQLWLQKHKEARDFRNEVRERQKGWRKNGKQNDDVQLKETEELA